MLAFTWRPYVLLSPKLPSIAFYNLCGYLSHQLSSIMCEIIMGVELNEFDIFTSLLNEG